MSKICIVGLGYVGLPLAHAFAAGGKEVIGYDINSERITELKQGIDRTREISTEDLGSVQIEFSDDPAVIDKANIIILAIPSPVDENNKPDLSLIESASGTVGEHLSRGDIVVYESTVYPGTTEEICGPILENASGLTCGEDFFLGYSPERINPGDKQHTVNKIIKVVAGQDQKTTDTLCELYKTITDAGVHRSPSIKVAEMAKAIENAQRDLNIAFINEIALLCNKCGIATHDVLEAARSKWNFLRFEPGLVGGHCIGVDPYYLVEKARQMGMETQMITAGRSVNDGMSTAVVEQVADGLKPESSILVLGLTFKPNVPDMRNSKSSEVVGSLKQRGFQVTAHDPFFASEDLEDVYDAVVLLVPHRNYLDDEATFVLDRCKDGGLVYDLKSVLDRDKVEHAGYIYRAL